MKNRYLNIPLYVSICLGLSFCGDDEAMKGDLPILESTITASDITTEGAKSGGTISSDGGSDVTSRGVCWSASPNPTINDFKTIDAAGTGSFISTLTGLQSGTIYYVRAYATNKAGTAYAAQVTFMTIPLIGQQIQGGKVAYVFTDDDPGYDPQNPHGIIVAPSDQSTSAPWGCSTTSILSAQQVDIGKGNQNTTNIITACSEAGIAAKLCYDLNLNGYSDWFLPSQNELLKVYETRASTGGFEGTFYWSSTQHPSNGMAHARNFSNGSGAASSKGNLHRVRAIRFF